MHRLLIVLGLTLCLAACGRSEEAKANMAASIAFMSANGKAAGVKTLPSGVQYRVITSGPADGPHPGPSDEVKVNYEGKLLSGTVFDSSFARGEPANFPLSGLIPAWTEALQQMRPGDEWMLYVPPEMGYGDKASGPIPPNSVLIFKIQLLGVLPHPGGTQLG
jgi:peptidylprolyl isomerase/FKBP-type peptidyl-prolyl cis-trans isomerase FklB